VQAGRQELAQFRYLGYLNRAGRSQAFLAKGNALLIVTAGETIEQRILVKTISPSGVTLQEAATKMEQFVTPSADASAMPGPSAVVPAQTGPSGYNSPAPPGFHGLPGNMPQGYPQGMQPAF
jgi:hypothetical protein